MGRSWKERYFVLTKKEFTYYENDTKKKEKGVFNLPQGTRVGKSTLKKNGLDIYTQGCTYHFRFKNNDEMTDLETALINLGVSQATYSTDMGGCPWLGCTNTGVDFDMAKYLRENGKPCTGSGRKVCPRRDNPDCLEKHRRRLTTMQRLPARRRRLNTLERVFADILPKDGEKN